jgi:hypothetical protein
LQLHPDDFGVDLNAACKGAEAAWHFSSGRSGLVLLVKSGARLNTTRYFEEQVLRKRPYIQRQWCQDVLAAPIRKEVQPDNRIRFWGKIVVPGEARPRYLRVVTLDEEGDGPQCVL